MKKINIICVDDEPELLALVMRDLRYFDDMFNIKQCNSAAECLKLLDRLDAHQKYIALIISDHIMPEKSGVELLTEVAADHRFLGVKKLLLPGKATQADTINAINHAKVDRILEKMWEPQSLIQMVKELLTEFILEKGIDYEPYVKKLDATTLYRLHKH